MPIVVTRSNCARSTTGTASGNTTASSIGAAVGVDGAGPATEMVVVGAAFAPSVGVVVVDTGGAIARAIMAGSNRTGTSSSLWSGAIVVMTAVVVGVAGGCVVVVVVVAATGIFSHHAIVVLAGSTSVDGADGPASVRVPTR